MKDDGKRYTVKSTILPEGAAGSIYCASVRLEDACDAAEKARGNAIIIDDSDGLPACMKGFELGCECHRCNGSDK